MRWQAQVWKSWKIIIGLMFQIVRILQLSNDIWKEITPSFLHDINPNDAMFGAQVKLFVTRFKTCMHLNFRILSVQSWSTLLLDFREVFFQLKRTRKFELSVTTDHHKICTFSFSPDKERN